MDEPIGRRALLAGAAGLGVGALLPGPAEAATSPWRRPLLSPAGMRYEGTYRLPQTVTWDGRGRDAAWGRAFALRRVDGRLRAISSTVDAVLYECDVPRWRPWTDLARTAAVPEAPLRAVFGPVTDPVRLLDPRHPGRGTDLLGLFVDPVGTAGDGWLWCSYGDGYNTATADDPTAVALRLSAQGPRPTSAGVIGPVRFPGRGNRATMSGVCAVPRWFSDRVAPGRRLAAGFGGYQSIVTMGPASMGPALSLFAPPAPTRRPVRRAVASTALVAYPFAAKPYGPPSRCQRDADYRDDIEGWKPRGGVGYWQWTDRIEQSGVMLDVPSVGGALVIGTLGAGRIWYGDGRVNAQRQRHVAFVYDPLVLAAVAGGRRRTWEVQPRRRWTLDFPGLPSVMRGGTYPAITSVIGVAVEPGRRRLHVAVRHGWRLPGDRWTATAVHVYRLG